MFASTTVVSRESFSLAAGRRLGKALLDKLGRAPDACWLFVSPQPGVSDLLKGVNDAVETPNLAGCTTAGEFSSEGFSTGSAVLGGIASDTIDFHVAHAQHLCRDSEQAGRELARQLPRTVRYVQIFSDGLSGNGCAILRGMTSVLGQDVPIAGGTAGDAERFRQTWQFAGKKMLSDSLVAIGFSGVFSVGIGVQSGWSPIGLAKKATRATGNTLYELNGEPALTVYERFLGKHAGKLPAVGVEYPLGLVGKCRDGSEEDYYLLRATMSINPTEGSINFAGEIPEGSMVYLTCGDTTSLLNATGKAIRLALADLGDAKPVMAFFYSCMARKTLLGRNARQELACVRRELGKGVPVLGFYTYGEYCRVGCKGPNLLHNETATISVIGV